MRILERLTSWMERKRMINVIILIVCLGLGELACVCPCGDQKKERDESRNEREKVESRDKRERLMVHFCIYKVHVLTLLYQLYS